MRFNQTIRFNMARYLAIVLLMIAVALPTAAIAIDALPFKDRAEEVRFQNLTSQLRCLQCQNESLAASQADLAKDLRQDIFKQMQAGKSDQQIKDWLTARYSDFVLYDPPLRGGTLLLWFGPLLLLLAGVVVIVTIVRRRSRANLERAPLRGSVDDW